MTSEYKNFHDWQNEKPALIARVVRAEAEVERLRAAAAMHKPVTTRSLTIPPSDRGYLVQLGWSDAGDLLLSAQPNDSLPGSFGPGDEAQPAPAPQPAPSGVVRSPDGVWTNSLSDAIAPLFVPAPRLRLPGKVAEMPQEDGIELGYAHGWSDGWNAAIHAAKAEARAQGFEVENTGTAPPVQTQGLEDSYGQSASEDQRVSGSLSRGDRRDERHQSRGRTPGGARGEAESDSGSGRTVAGDRSNAAPAGRDEPRAVRRQAHDFLNGEGACAPVCAPSNAPALPDNADPGDEAQPARSGEAERERCGVCGWTLAESRDNGCVAGDCSYDRAIRALGAGGAT